MCSCYVPSRKFVDGVCNNEMQNQEGRNINGGGCSSAQVLNARKSNLKKTAKSLMVVENSSQPTEKRKVSWSDAHGKDIAHIQEFEPSVYEDGELEGVRNSCVCAIQ